MEVFLLILRIFLFAIFLVAGIGKLLDLKGSEKAVKDFGVPENLAKSFGLILPIVEISLAVLLLFVETSWFASFGVAFLLLMFIGGMLWQLKQGNAPNCHCFGQIHSEPVSKKSLVRNGVFGLLTIPLMFAGRENQGLSLTATGNDLNGFMLVIFGVIFAGLLVVGLVFIKRILEQQNRILRRLEVLELITNDGSPRTHDELDDPFKGLPIGSYLFDFELPTVDGKTLDRAELLADGKPILLLNVGPNCHPCEELLPQIEKWENELGDKINFLFLSKGTPQENLEKFNATKNRRIILQKDREFAELLEIKWTPTAIFFNKNGMIASRAAVGGEAIIKLVEDIEKGISDADFQYIANANGNALNIGKNIPEFSLNDIAGKQISSNDLNGKKTLVTFWSVTCGHCVAMIEDLSKWEKIKGQDEPNLLFFSDGDASDHEKFHINSPIILDKDYQTSVKFGMNGTPSAVLVDENGKFISETAIGAGQIWALLGRRK